MVDSLARQAERPRIDVRVSRGGPAISSAAANEPMERFAFLKIPDSPVEALDGSAEVAGNEARAAQIRVMNRSAKPVRYVEIGWIVKDRRGKRVPGWIGARRRGRPAFAARSNRPRAAGYGSTLLPQCRPTGIHCQHDRFRQPGGIRGGHGLGAEPRGATESRACCAWWRLHPKSNGWRTSIAPRGWMPW